MLQSVILEDLRARIARIEGTGVRHESIPFGVDAVDSRLPGGGIATGALHEIAGSAELADDASATIFLAGILARIDGPVLWCLRLRDLFAPALHLAGLHPDRVIHVEAGSDANVLLAMEECLRHAGLAGVVGEIGKYSTTASKRLQLAAEGSGVAAFVLRGRQMQAWKRFPEKKQPAPARWPRRGDARTRIPFSGPFRGLAATMRRRAC